ncbi:MAG: hypothetical protein AB9922_01920 [Bacteroidales bacterium]
MKLNYTYLVLIVITLCSCSGSLSKIRESGVKPLVSHTEREKRENYRVEKQSDSSVKSFVITDKSGKEFVINEAIKDEESGEILNMRHLNEVCIIAKSRNVSERAGVVPLSFIVKVPASIIKSDLQLILKPIVSKGVEEHVSELSSHQIVLEPIVLSGDYFKRSQLKGYKRYEQFLKSIIPDGADTLEVFTYLTGLSIFLERYLPESMLLSGIGNDTLTTETGVREREIYQHFLKQWLIERNNRKKAARSEVYEKLVKNPFLNNVRLDSVIKGSDGDFYYHYTQDFNVKERFKKLYLNLTAQVRDVNGSALILPTSDTLTYYISSLLNFADTTLKYKKIIRERRISEDVDIRISFQSGSYKIIEELGGNRVEIDKFRKILESFSDSKDLTIDSISVTSYCSPEGSFRENEKLAGLRGESVINYFGNHNIKTGVRDAGEDWKGFTDYILTSDSLISKDEIISKLQIADPDKREKEISRFRVDYKYLREAIYPKLRRVSYRFFLSRNDMTKDTIHTTVVDSLYMKGSEMLMNRDYKGAFEILKEYRDINCVVAMISLGMEQTALQTLSGMKECDKTLYLASILHSRTGDEKLAKELFTRAVELNPSIFYRGLLDPEISSIIRKYNLENMQLE